MRTVLFTLLATLSCPGLLFAQSQVFIGGEMFADLKRFSDSTTSITSTLNGNAVGGGASVGVLVSERWSVELAVDLGASTTKTTTVPIVVPLTPSVVLPIGFSSTTTNRLLATSALLGYHSGPGHRLRPGVFGGLTFLHVRRRFESPFPPPLARFPPFVPGRGGNLVSPIVFPLPPTYLAPRVVVQSDNVPAATVGAEAAIELTTHLAAVPEVRAHAFSLSNGPSGFALRPGIALRWTF